LPKTKRRLTESPLHFCHSACPATKGSADAERKHIEGRNEESIKTSNRRHHVMQIMAGFYSDLIMDPSREPRMTNGAEASLQRDLLYIARDFNRRVFRGFGRLLCLKQKGDSPSRPYIFVIPPVLRPKEVLTQSGSISKGPS